jgi:hypothetical protein
MGQRRGDCLTTSRGELPPRACAGVLRGVSGGTWPQHARPSALVKFEQASVRNVLSARWLQVESPLAGDACLRVAASGWHGSEHRRCRVSGSAPLGERASGAARRPAVRVAAAWHGKGSLEVSGSSRRTTPREIDAAVRRMVPQPACQWFRMVTRIPLEDVRRAQLATEFGRLNSFDCLSARGTGWAVIDQERCIDDHH